MMTDDGRTARRHDRRGPDLRCRVGSVRPPRDHGTRAPAPADPLMTAETVRTRGETVVVAVAGEIDLQSADVLRCRLLDLADSGYRTLVVDFAGVRFCDAAGLGALVAVHNRVTAGGGQVRLSRVRPAQRKLLRVTGLHRVFPLYDDPDDALNGTPARGVVPRG